MCCPMFRSSLPCRASNDHPVASFATELSFRAAVGGAGGLVWDRRGGYGGAIDQPAEFQVRPKLMSRRRLMVAARTVRAIRLRSTPR